MSTTFAFYADAGLTAPLASLAVLQGEDGSTPAADRTVYFGSTASGKTLRANSNPGVDQIAVSIADSATGSGPAASQVKLALSAGGLAGATGGASLNLGTSIASGTGGAVPVYVRVDTPALTPGSYADLSLNTNTVIES